MKINIVLTSFVLLSSLVIQAMELRWVSSGRGRQRPHGAVEGGREGGDSPWSNNLYVCRGHYNGGLHPGKMFNDVCNIGWGGREIVLDSYEVLVGTGYWSNNSSGAIVGGNESNGHSLYICRGQHDEGANIGSLFTLGLVGGYKNFGIHPGKVVNGKCNIGYGGKEFSLRYFEYLHAGSNPASTQAQPRPSSPPVSIPVPVEIPSGMNCIGRCEGTNVVAWAQCEGATPHCQSGCQASSSGLQAYANCTP